MILSGILDVSVWWLVGLTVLSCHITLLSVTLFLHRSQAHRSVDFHPAVSHFFRAWLWITTGMVTREWVAVHRKHHARVETEDDPHSPVVHGIRKVLLEGAELYRAEAAKPETLAQFGRGTPDDWLEKKLYSRFPWLGIACLLLLEFLLFGIAGIAVFAFQMLCIPVLAAGVINGLGHYLGYRNYQTRDTATNLMPLAMIICGEELHNNHHAYPSSAKFSSRRWEFDLGWFYIRLLSAVRLASIKRVAPVPVFRQDKVSVDLDTVKAIIASKLHVMENYANSVVRPVHQSVLTDAIGQARTAISRVKPALFVSEFLHDDEGHSRLQAAIDENESLRVVHEYGVRLRETWASATCQDGLIRDLQEWCQQAEETGIQCLQEFAERLRGYSLEPASY